MAGISNAKAAAINSSGTEAPSKKLKADRACNSTYSLITKSEIRNVAILNSIRDPQFRNSAILNRNYLLQTRYHYPILDKCDKEFVCPYAHRFFSFHYLTQALHPIHLEPNDQHATNHPSFSTALPDSQLCRKHSSIFPRR